MVSRSSFLRLAFLARFFCSTLLFPIFFTRVTFPVSSTSLIASFVKCREPRPISLVDLWLFLLCFFFVTFLQPPLLVRAFSCDRSVAVLPSSHSASPSLPRYAALGFPAVLGRSCSPLLPFPRGVDQVMQSVLSFSRLPHYVARLIWSALVSGFCVLDLLLKLGLILLVPVRAGG